MKDLYLQDIFPGVNSRNLKEKLVCIPVDIESGDFPPKQLLAVILSGFMGGLKEIKIAYDTDVDVTQELSRRGFLLKYSLIVFPSGRKEGRIVVTLSEE